MLLHTLGDIQMTYFTREFTNLPRERKVEEISTMLLRVLYDANADTDSNIALVDRLLELRPEVQQRSYPKATSLQERIQQFESAVEQASERVDELRSQGVTDADELETAYYDELRKINSMA
jgi:hypothetical protein